MPSTGIQTPHRVYMTRHLPAFRPRIESLWRATYRHSDPALSLYGALPTGIQTPHRVFMARYLSAFVHCMSHYPALLCHFFLNPTVTFSIDHPLQCRSHSSYSVISIESRSTRANSFVATIHPTGGEKKAWRSVQVFTRPPV